MKWALNRFRESAFLFCNADFYRSTSFVSRLNLMALCTLYPDPAPPASPADFMVHILTASQLRGFTTKDTYYMQRFSDNPASGAVLQDDWEGGLQNILKMTETKASPLVSPVWDFRYRTVTSTFSYSFHCSKSIYQLRLQKGHLSKHCFSVLPVPITAPLPQKGWVPLIPKRSKC